MKVDFSHADRAEAQKLNVILWRDAMGTDPFRAVDAKAEKDEEG
jgi:hypothetical protein